MALVIPRNLAQSIRPGVKMARHECESCGWTGYARMTFAGEPLNGCPHDGDSPFEEWTQDHINPDVVQEAQDLRALGRTIREIADTMNCAPSSVHRYLKVDLTA